jgi:hypothetical protein
MLSRAIKAKQIERSSRQRLESRRFDGQVAIVVGGAQGIVGKYPVREYN